MRKNLLQVYMQDAGFDDLLPKQDKERTKVKGNDAYDLYEYVDAIESLFEDGKLHYTDNRDEEETGMDTEFAKDESDVEVKEKEVDKEVTMKTDIDTGSESNELEIGGPEKMDPYMETEDESGMKLPMSEKATAETDIDSESIILEIGDPEMMDPNIENQDKLVIPSYKVNNITKMEVETVVSIDIDEKNNGDPETMGPYMECD